MKSGNTTIVPIRDFAFDRILSDGIYAFPESSGRRILDYMAFYRTKPTSAITHYSKVESVDDGDIDMQYRAICFGDKANDDAKVVQFEWTKELEKPIAAQKYGIQGVRITTKDSLLNSESFDDIE